MEREIFPDIAKSGDMAGLTFEGYFVDAGTPSSFIDATQVCISSSRFDSGSSCCESWVSDGVCKSGVTGSSIGKEAELGEDVTIRDSVVMDGAQIGSRVQLNRCIVGEGASISSGTELTDAVIGHGSTI